MLIDKEYGEWVRFPSTPEETTYELKIRYSNILKDIIDELKNSKRLFSNKNIIIDSYIYKINSIIDDIKEFFYKEKIYGLHHAINGNIYYDEVNGQPKYKIGSVNCSIYCEIDLETYDKFEIIIDKVVDIKNNYNCLNSNSINRCNEFIDMFNYQKKLLTNYSYTNYFTKRFNKNVKLNNDFIHHLKEIGKDKILDNLIYIL